MRFCFTEYGNELRACKKNDSLQMYGLTSCTNAQSYGHMCPMKAPMHVRHVENDQISSRSGTG